MEHGLIAPTGRAFLKSLVVRTEDPDVDLPSRVIELVRVHLDPFQGVKRAWFWERCLRDGGRDDPETVRRQTAEVIAAVSAMAITAFGSPLEGFRRGGDFAVWLVYWCANGSAG
jgi:hypothetical protein